MMISNALFNTLGHHEFQGAYQLFLVIYWFYVSKFCNDKYVYMYDDLVLSNISLTDTGYIYELLLNIATCPGVSSPMINQPVIKSHS